MKKILMLHGINHNLFGKRDPKQYGKLTLDEINEKLLGLSEELDVQLEFYQTNYEGEMCERIHRAFLEKIDGVLINAGAWTHYSYGIRDALELLEVPIIEIHMSNIYKREDFRRKSVFEDLAQGQIVGFGLDSYLLGLRAMMSIIKS